MYLVSLGAGILAGILYGALGVRSPAPPAIALVGLLGMLIGEQVVPVAKRLMDGTPITKAWFAAECQPRITGVPNAKTEAKAQAEANEASRQG